jgi:DeoR/GlpR family transcriptional regulator of sugar metabolism
VGRRNLTIITSSLHIANLFYNLPDIRLIVSGGIVRLGEASLIGDLAKYSYQNLSVDRLLLGVGGIDVQSGLTEYNWDDALVKQAMIASAKEVILVADASKFNRVAFARVAPLNIVHQIVTDRPPTGELLETFNRLGILIHSAGEEDELPIESQEDK